MLTLAPLALVPAESADFNWLWWIPMLPLVASAVCGLLHFLTLRQREAANPRPKVAHGHGHHGHETAAHGHDAHAADAHAADAHAAHGHDAHAAGHAAAGEHDVVDDAEDDHPRERRIAAEKPPHGASLPICQPSPLRV